jgi:hypothetical protein
MLRSKTGPVRERKLVFGQEFWNGSLGIKRGACKDKSARIARKMNPSSINLNPVMFKSPRKRTELR